MSTPTRTPSPTRTPTLGSVGVIDGPLCFEITASPEERAALQSQCSPTSATAPDSDVTLLGYNIHFNGVAYNPDGTSTWSYTVTPRGATKALSYWILTWYPGRPLLSSSPAAAVVLDLPTGIYGVKWAQKLLPTDGPRTYSFSVKGHWATGESQVAVGAP